MCLVRGIKEHQMFAGDVPADRSTLPSAAQPSLGGTFVTRTLSQSCNMASSGSGRTAGSGPTGSFIYVVYIPIIYCRPVVTSVLYK